MLVLGLLWASGRVSLEDLPSHIRCPNAFNSLILPNWVSAKTSSTYNSRPGRNLKPESNAGYSWDVVVCTQCDGLRHLGWRFTSSATGEAFTALIVEYAEGARREADARTRALEALTLGVRAPAWVLALAAVAISSASNGVPKP